jgi:hypothetical protein
VLAGRIQEQHTANWHLMNSNRSLTGDFLEVAYRMAAGELPGADDFFLEGDMGSATLDGVRLSLKRSSLEWALERLRRDPALLDYVQLAVPRGFHRPGGRPGAAARARGGREAAGTPKPTGNGGGPEGSRALVDREADSRCDSSRSPAGPRSQVCSRSSPWARRRRAAVHRAAVPAVTGTASATSIARASATARSS